jgi:hypothetical protein
VLFLLFFLLASLTGVGPGEDFIVHDQSRLDGVCREIPRATVLNYGCVGMRISIRGRRGNGLVALHTMIEACAARLCRMAEAPRDINRMLVAAFRHCTAVDELKARTLKLRIACRPARNVPHHVKTNQGERI